MNKPTFSAPYPSKAEMDYRQNGLVLPNNKSHLEILLRDVHEKGFLDLELLYRLKQKEALKRIEQEIEYKLRDNDQNELRESCRTFQKAFQRSLELAT